MSQIDVKDLKKGDRFCEFSGYSLAIRLTATEDARLTDGYWECVAVSDSGDPVKMGCHEKYPHYGPKLYKGSQVPYLGVEYI